MKNTPEAFRLIGLKLPNKTSNENNQSSRDCGHLWQQFETEKIINSIPDKLSDEIYAVYFDYEPDDKGLFSYFIGCKVPENVVVPEGLEALLALVCNECLKRLACHRKFAIPLHLTPCRHGRQTPIGSIRSSKR